MRLPGASLPRRRSVIDKSPCQILLSESTSARHRVRLRRSILVSRQLSPTALEEI